MNQKQTQVSELLKLGFGRRRIAKEMGISEWEARSLIDQVLKGNLVEQEFFGQKPEVSLRQNDKIIPNRETKSTLVSVKPRSQVIVPNTISMTRNSTLKVGCVSDIHFPYQDEVAEQIALEFLADYSPDILIWNGDIFDFYALSAYNKDIKKKMDIQEEIDYGAERISIWTKILNKTKHYFIEGNHEERLSKSIKRNMPALAALRSTSIEKNIDFEKIGLEYVPSHKDLFIGNMLFTHGNVVRSFGGYSVKSQYDQLGCSTLIGHTHRLSIAHKRTKLGTHTVVENGTLCDFDVEYSNFPNWQHGFTTLEFDGDDFSVSQHLINRYKLIANGRVYVR